MTVLFDLKDRVVLVTGGSKGIGKSIALEFLRSGAKVAVCARGEADLCRFQSEISAYQTHFLPIRTDATSESSVQNCVRTTAEHFGKIDVLVNNVGGAIKFGDLFTLNKQDWQNAFDLNVQTMVSFSKASISSLKKSKFPRIINVSSISGVEPGFFNPHYATTKAATINFSKYLANFLARDKILVNCICPGTVISDAWAKSVTQIASEKGVSPEEVEKELLSTETAKIPLGRIGEGKDIAKFALFLASDEAMWITGSCFHLNGGKMRAMC